MLVLSRKKDESIVIGRDVTVTVVETRGDKVRLGIDAPRDVPVHRSEVAEAIRKANEAMDAADDAADESARRREPVAAR